MSTAQTEARAVDTAVVEAIHALRLEQPGRAYDILVAAIKATLAAKNAEIAALKKEAADVVRPFAEVPLEGTFGGPLCGAKGLYEDGSEPEYNPDRSILGREPFCAARSFLDKWEGRDG